MFFEQFKMIYAIILSFSALFNVGNSFTSMLGTEKIKINYNMTDSAISNPFMGFAPNAENTELAQNASLVYIDISFKELQPHGPDSFDFDNIAKENNIERWKSEGKHAVLRFLCDIPEDNEHTDIPDWLFQMTGDGDFYNTSYGKGYSPNYSNEIFIKYHRAAILELGNYFSDGFLAYVELGSLGHWGEWHVKAQSGIKELPREEIRNEYVSHYIAAFSEAKLLMRRPFTAAANFDLGLYNDMIGHENDTEEWLDWINTGGEYSQTGEKNALSPMRDFWKKSPSGGEFTSSVSMDYMCGAGLEDTLRMLSLSHTTFIGPKYPYEEKFKTNSDKILSKIGYRIGITEVAITKNSKGIPFIAELTWKNEGIAPLYFDCPIRLYISDDSVSIPIAEVDLDLTNLLPGETVKTKTLFSCESITDSKYLTLGILDVTNNENKIKLISSQELTKDNLTKLYKFESK